MKKFVYGIICFLIVSLVCLAGDVTISNLKATTNSDAVNIEWQTTAEDGVLRFEVQRLTASGFKTIEPVSAKGKPSFYKYTDSDSFTKDAASLQDQNKATYRLKVVYTSSQVPTYTDEVFAIRNVSSIKRTLGMLKEMFK
jgi:hypothetical protein